MAATAPAEKTRSILDEVASPHPFHESRKEAAKRPKSAQDKLAPFATLKVKVVRARDITASDWSMFGSPTSDPYCEIHVNDEFKKKTDTKSGTVTPVWNWECELKISKPGSVVQLQLFDEDLVGDSDLLGYLEFPVADLPFDECISGWFVLFPPEALQSEAPARIAKTIKGPVEETCGSIFLELTYKTVSGDPTDEFYAWCLPQPTFKAYPETGYVPAAMKALDAQLVIDQLLDIKEYAVDDLVFPVLSGFIYIIVWREVLVSAFCLAVVLACSLRPTFFPAGLILIQATLFLLLKNPERRRKMSTHPALVPLDDEGFKLIALLQDTDKMVAFLSRVIDIQMDGTVTDEAMLRSFAAFSANAGVPVTSYEEMKKQLRESATKLSEPFVTFSTYPYAAGCLVLHGHKTGEVLSTVNPKGAPDFKYMVKFADAHGEGKADKEPGADKGKGKHKEKAMFTEEEVPGNELELRLDFRWVSNGMVLALIPDITETLIMEAAEPLAIVCPIVHQVNKIITDLYQWKNTTHSMGLVAVLYIVAGVASIFGWIGIPGIAFVILDWVRLIVTVSVVTLLFVFNADFFISFVAQAQSFVLSKQHAAKDAKNWGFLLQDSQADESMPGKKGKNKNGAAADGEGGFFGCAACARKQEDEVKAVKSPKNNGSADAKSAPKKEDSKKK